MKGPILKAIEEAEYIKRSPAAEGAVGAIKGAIVGAPAGAIIGKLSGGSAVAGSFVGGLMAAAAFGIGHAIAQDIDNKEKESALKVYLENLKSREPFFYMPPRPLFERVVRSVRRKER